MTDQKLESIQVETSQPLMVCDIEIQEITKLPVVLTEKSKKESKKKL
jgi:hypothetical protein